MHSRVTARRGKSWNYDSGDLFLPKEKPVISDGQIEDLGGLQAGVHCTVLQEEGDKNK